MLVVTISSALYLLTFFDSVYSVINGERVHWHQYGYLVKIFSRERNSKMVTSCSGSIISASLVLTSPQCLFNASTNRRFDEVAVSMPPFRKARTVRAEIVKSTDSWALLKVPTLSAKELCPASPTPKRVVQLNVRLSLVRSSHIVIDISAITKRRCWLTGFATTPNAADFLNQYDVRMIALDALKHSDDSTSDMLLYRADVIANNSACWDDAGAALICHLNEFGDVQVGIFHNLVTAPIDTGKGGMELMPHWIHECGRALGMNFALTVNDQGLISAIEKHDLPAFVDIYRKCHFESNH
uniref:Peptidase S1 domain-containing protein n=1 Tax=Parascaris univalens TaxID=6257 RepID=A0A915B8K6_PARUN